MLGFIGAAFMQLIDALGMKDTGKQSAAATSRSNDRSVSLGIEVLLEDGVYEAAFPLHDQLFREEDAGAPETWNDRMVNPLDC